MRSRPTTVRTMGAPSASHIRSSSQLIRSSAKVRVADSGPALQEPLESRPDPPLLAVPHARDQRPHEPQNAIRPEVPVPPHPRAVVDGFEVEPAREVHRLHLHALPDPAGPLELGYPDRHWDDPTTPCHLGMERRSSADRPLGRLSRDPHPLVVLGLVLLIRHEVEDLFHRAPDQDVAIHLDHRPHPQVVANPSLTRRTGDVRAD